VRPLAGWFGAGVAVRLVAEAATGVAVADDVSVVFGRLAEAGGFAAAAAGFGGATLTAVGEVAGLAGLRAGATAVTIESVAAKARGR
jgi:hypothetical protein